MLRVREMRVDCDLDAILVRVDAVGPGVCHEGYRSCFFRRLDADGDANVVDERTFDPDAVYGEGPREQMKPLRLRACPRAACRTPRVQLFARAGWRITVNSRSYFPGIDDPEINCMLVRAQEMARYVETGALDAGITGRDWVLETGANVRRSANCCTPSRAWRRCAGCWRCPKTAPMQSAKDLKGK